MHPEDSQVLRRTAPAAAYSGPVSMALVLVARLHVMRARQLLLRMGLHPGQELVLMHLWDRGPLRQSELMVAFDTDSASMTRTVQRLERSGYVRRSPHPTDRRATLVESTTAGDALREQMEQLWMELEAATVGGMSSGERTRLLNDLGQIQENLVRNGPKDVPGVAMQTDRARFGAKSKQSTSTDP